LLVSVSCATANEDSSTLKSITHSSICAPLCQFYPKLIKPQVVLSCSFAHAAVSTFQMVVGPHCHTMDIQKQNFRSRKPLPLE
ncbi:hypothetical protein T03_1315, partial [Trichinella britovi]